MSARPLVPRTYGDRLESADDTALERLYGKVEAMEGILSNLSTVRLASLETKLDDLHNLLSRRRKDHYLIEEVAGMTGRSEYTIRRWVAEGKLRAIRVAEGGPRGRLLIPRTELERLVAVGKGAQVPEVAIV